MAQFEENLNDVDLRGMRPVQNIQNNSSLAVGINLGVQAIEAFAAREKTSLALAEKQAQVSMEALANQDAADAADLIDSGVPASQVWTIYNAKSKEINTRDPENAGFYLAAIEKNLGKTPAKFIVDNAAEQEKQAAEQKQKWVDYALKNGYISAPLEGEDTPISVVTMLENIQTEQDTKRAIEKNSVEVPNLAYKVGSNNVAEMYTWLDFKGTNTQLFETMGKDPNRFTVATTLRSILNKEQLDLASLGKFNLAVDQIAERDIMDYQQGLLQGGNIGKVDQKTLDAALENIRKPYENLKQMAKYATEGADGWTILQEMKDSIAINDADYALKNTELNQKLELIKKAPEALQSDLAKTPLSDGRTVQETIIGTIQQNLKPTVDTLSGQRKWSDLSSTEKDSVLLWQDRVVPMATTITRDQSGKSPIAPKDVAGWGEFVKGVTFKAGENVEDFDKTITTLVNPTVLKAVDKLRDVDVVAANELTESYVFAQSNISNKVAKSISQYPKGLIVYDETSDEHYVDPRKLQQALLADSNLLSKSGLPRQELEKAEAEGRVSIGVGGDSYAIKRPGARGGSQLVRKQSNPIYRELTQAVARLEKAAALSVASDLNPNSLLQDLRSTGYIVDGRITDLPAERTLPEARDRATAAALRKKLGITFKPAPSTVTVEQSLSFDPMLDTSQDVAFGNVAAIDAFENQQGQ